MSKYQADPEKFKITDGKLYLFYNEPGFDALVWWNRGDEAQLLNNADEYWTNLVGE